MATVPAGPLPPFGPILVDVAAWTVRAAELTLVLGAFELARQLSSNSALAVVASALKVAVMLVLFADIWTRSEGWWTHPNFSAGVNRRVMQLVYLVLPVLALLFLSAGPFDAILADVGRSLAQ